MIFNKVITAQYFTWFAFLILVVIPLPSSTRLNTYSPILSASNRSIFSSFSSFIHFFALLIPNRIFSQQNGEISSNGFIQRNEKSVKKNYFWRIFFTFFAWIFSLSLWLFLAYQLEFESKNTFHNLWLASLLFHIINIVIIIFIISNYREKSKKNEKKGK